MRFALLPNPASCEKEESSRTTLTPVTVLHLKESTQAIFGIFLLPSPIKRPSMTKSPELNLIQMN